MLRWRALSPNHFTSGEGANQVLCAILGWPATPALIPNSFRASVRTTAAHIGIPPIRVVTSTDASNLPGTQGLTRLNPQQARPDCVQTHDRAEFRG
jgi:hypothetical protein